MPDRRRFQRVNIPSQGRFMRANKDEFPCQIIDVSAGGIAIQADITGEIGEHIIIYTVNVGRIEGEIARIFEGGFALRLSASVYKREKIVNQLTWLINKDKLSALDNRLHNRFVPNKLKAMLTVADGTTHECQIVDMSLGGAAVIVEPMPEVGEAIILGLIQGRVIRHTDIAINIQFLEIQDPTSLERQFN